MSLSKQAEFLGIALVEGDGNLRAGKVHRSMLKLTVPADVEAGIARAHVQTAAVAMAYLMHDIQP